MSQDLALTCEKSVIWIYGREHVIVSHHSAKFKGHRHCASRDNMVLVLPCDLSKPPNQRVMWVCRWKPAKFEGHGHCGSRDIMVFVSHVILEEHLT